MEEKRGKHSQTIATAADWPAQVILLEDLTRGESCACKTVLCLLRHLRTTRKAQEALMTADSIDELQLPRNRENWKFYFGILKKDHLSWEIWVFATCERLPKSKKVFTLN